MHTIHMSRLLAGALLIASLMFSACSVFGDDDDEDVPTVAGETASVTLTELAAQSTSASPESTEGDRAGAQDPTEATDDPVRDDESGPNLATRVEQVTDEVRPAVVFIAVTQLVSQPTGQPGEQEGVGSGVIFDAEGYILTNNHVIEGADELQVVLPDGRQFDASILGRAPRQDLAVIQIDGDDLPVAALAEGDDLDIGEWVIAIGNALGLEGGASVTVGVVSALDRTLRASQTEPAIEGLIQTDAAINPGNSGGPLVNLNSEVVGINTAKIPQAEGIGFAVPSSTARNIIDQILTGEPQATLGVTVTNVTPEVAVRFNLPTDSGALVIELDVDGPAASAGVQPGDVIIGIEGQEVESISDVRSILDGYEPGESVSVTVNRGGQIQDIDVVLGESIIIR